MCSLQTTTQYEYRLLKRSLQSINNFWALFHIPARNKGRLTTQSMIFSNCWKAYLGKLHGNMHITHYSKELSSGSSTTQNFKMHVPTGEESEHAARKLYSLCEFGWIAPNSETSPLTTPTQELFSVTLERSCNTGSSLPTLHPVLFWTQKFLLLCGSCEANKHTLHFAIHFVIRSTEQTSVEPH